MATNVAAQATDLYGFRDVFEASRAERLESEWRVSANVIEKRRTNVDGCDRSRRVWWLSYRGFLRSIGRATKTAWMNRRLRDALRKSVNLHSLKKNAGLSDVRQWPRQITKNQWAL
jgi:hypothetical protein